MEDFDAARLKMVDSQLRTEGVTDYAVLGAMGGIPRERFVPPRKGRAHALRVVREVLGAKPQGVRTDLALPLEVLRSLLPHRRSVIAMISDLESNDDAHADGALDRSAAALAAHAVAMPIAGFVPAGAGLFVAATALFGSSHWIRNFTIGVAISVVLYAVFTAGLVMALPQDPLTRRLSR